MNERATFIRRYAHAYPHHINRSRRRRVPSHFSVHRRCEPISHTRFLDDFDTGSSVFTPKINFTLFCLSFVMGIAGFVYVGLV